MMMASTPIEESFSPTYMLFRNGSQVQKLNHVQKPRAENWSCEMEKHCVSHLQEDIQALSGIPVRAEAREF
jgi:hypothetical protein